MSFYSKDIPTFSGLVIKNTLVKRQHYFRFMQGFHLRHRQTSLREGRTFHYKLPFILNRSSRPEVSVL